jgi:hypothetical protein
MKTRNLILSFGIILGITIYAPFTAVCQVCSGHWVNSHPLTFQCLSGQQIGYNNVTGDPSGCPNNPGYTPTQTNSFIFDNPVNDFFIDFNALDCTVTGCPRMQIKINGIFYPLTAVNLSELPTGTICSGSVSFLTITSDGYITTAVALSNGQGRLVFSGVNASSITISTNDRGGGIIVGNPCFEPLPIQIKSFKGYGSGNCEVKLEFESGIESNVRNIEIEGSIDGAAFTKLLELAPKGSDSRYTIQCKSSGSNFYRLRINDLDGNFSYSDIIRISNNCASSPILISPNPSAQKIFVENVQLNDQLIILDMLGRELSRIQAMHHPTEINIQELPAGLYFLKVYRNKVKVETAKFIKV